MKLKSVLLSLLAVSLLPSVEMCAQQVVFVKSRPIVSDRPVPPNPKNKDRQLENSSNSPAASNPLHIPCRSKQATPDLMDLAAYYTSSLKGGNLGSLPSGVRAFSKAAFDIRGMIQLAGMKPSSHPDAVRGIAIHYKGEKIDFLHGAAGYAEEDSVIGNYVLHYANGVTKRIPLVYGRNIQNSFGVDAVPVLTDAAAVRTGKNVQVFKYTANNPLPGIEIKTMDFVSNNTRAAPFLIAMTIEPIQAERTYEWFDSIKAWNPDCAERSFGRP